MRKDYIENITNAERRYFAQPLAIEQREGKESRTISGYAAVFNRDSKDFGGWVERIDPRAFDERMADDAVALFNHDPNLILARNNVNLKLTIDGVGLRYEFDAPNTTAGNDLLENIRNGNIKQSSFAFIANEVKWYNPSDKNQPSVRTIMKVERLYDVSPVTYPAYPDTTVASRSLKTKLDHEERETKNHLINLMKRKHELFQLSQ
ncbi:MAG: HK97 family phage prohead protease [Cyclobacteriaceae bacterium]